MGESTINTCLCDLFYVRVIHSLSLVNLFINYPEHLAVLSRRLSEIAVCELQEKHEMMTIIAVRDINLSG